MDTIDHNLSSTTAQDSIHLFVLSSFGGIGSFLLRVTGGHQCMTVPVCPSLACGSC